MPHTVTLNTPICDLNHGGGLLAAKLRRLGVRNVRDLLFLFPRDYEFPAPATSIDQLRDQRPASLVGEVTDVSLTSRTPGKSTFSAIVENDTGAVRILFFNQPFRAEQIQYGNRVLLSGKPKLSGLRWEFVHPKVTLLDKDQSVQAGTILPIYPLTEGIKQIHLRKLAAEVLDFANGLTEVMPESLREVAAKSLRQEEIDIGERLPSISDALHTVHRPQDEARLTAARTRFIFQELLVMQLALSIRRRQLTTQLLAPPLPPSPAVHARILKRFPFELTGDQHKAISQIAKDMSRQFPMNRLLQGDVGTGKTVVATYAMLLSVAQGHQAVLMAPTEVLARQHHKTLTRMLNGSRIRVGLLCGSLSTAQRRETIQGAASGELQILVGTQSLLHGGIEFDKLGLCVIDEQHKFGVEQRVSLRSGGIDPHYLVMSATPIPRSIAMTVFGDVELSTLKEKPPGRGKVNTYLAQDGWKARWWDFVRQRLDEGRQAYVVAPRVSATDTGDRSDQDADESENVSSVQEIYDQLSRETFADYRVALLHGGMTNEEKEATMAQFARGDIHVLVSTTVIEVGIDVANATVMTILGANRFGLSQLHQLRGRISRGVHAGHVGIFTDGKTDPQEVERLRVLEQTEDGFELAEADFRMRGPGDVLGKRQSGLPPMRIADLARDQSILAVARTVSQELIDEDPELGDESLSELREQVMRRYGKRLDLGDVA